LRAKPEAPAPSWGSGRAAFNDPILGGSLALPDLITRALARERTLRFVGVPGSAAPYLVRRLRAAHPGVILVAAPGSRRADRFAAELRTFLRGRDALASRVAVLPRYDTALYDRFSPHPEIEARRMSLLYSLLAAGEATPLTVVAPWSALVRRVLPRAELRARLTHHERGLAVDRDALLQVLVSAGYHRASLVEERGEVAARGGILDLFPPHLERPVRIEFGFDQIASLRTFDPATQRSTEELRSVVAIPPRSFRLAHDTDALVQRVRAYGREKRVPESNLYAVTEALSRRHAPPGIESLEALLHDSLETVFDYLPEKTLVVVEDPDAGRARARRGTEAVFEAHARATREDRLVCEPLELYTTDDDAFAAALARRPILLDALGTEVATETVAADEIRVPVRASSLRDLRREIEAERGSGRALEPLVRRLAAWRAAGKRVRLACPSLSSAERLADILRDYGAAVPVAGPGEARWDELPEPGAAEIAIAKLTDGFDLPPEGLVLVTEEDIFGARQTRRSPARVLRGGAALEALAQVQEGDFLVHAEHGIGRYGGLVQIPVGGARQEFLLLHYAQGDKLYLPVSRLAQVQRYTGAEGAPPTVDRLGGQLWARAQRRVRRAVREMAEELVAIYAAREVLQGHAYPPPDAGYEEFEARFPYEDTPDQHRATEEVLADLARERPMDRLVCGDVGFGKTEIACRAAYVVAASGRQVAFLVPTTVLCQQHAATLRTRLEGTALEVASLSRLSAPAEARAVREGLASGRIDVVVGTHRLLSADVQFRNLGLLVIDEEHRFGVAHKEKLKALRKLVDVLTLTATPIPRTLSMALSGIRDLSVIATPPPDRSAVRTEVCRFSDEIVRDVTLRELRRGGQVFFVHNRVETIGEIERWLRALVPEARIAVAHGQMTASRLEDVMLAFLRREHDVLLCTSIIESGLDIPDANTILIHRADRFGLAQLYQLRGRVGRRDRRAYAYLFLPPEGQLTDEARRRIEAIQDLSELGAGFRLATHDLEIRGAGNMLGAEQSGHIAAVGYDLYVEMLDQAIRELRGQSADAELEPEIKLPVPALLPESYVASVNQRLVLYKQLSSARDHAELADIRADLLDRFGPLPPEAATLLEVIRLKIGCRELGIAAVELAGSELALRVAPRSRLDPRRLLPLLEKPGTPLRVTSDQRIWLRVRRPEDALAESFGLLELLAPGGATPSAAAPAPGGTP
jgi:transcription-repair coupling factor (superfamily II helicase)